ncbi:universal stress protein [Streptomyces xiamenensis]|uniref:universal stress protein n=1 Tax=Streptomyces xiamenensis TaxID=408015 RepID=UPI0036B74B4C
MTLLPVTAGVDGSAEGSAAAHWAAEEAIRRGLRLRLVHGWGLASPLEPVVDRASDEQRRAQRLLREAQEALLERHPRLNVSLEALADGPRTALLDVSHDSELLVLGSRGLSPLAGFLLGSVSGHIVGNTGCPVVVVRSSGGTANGDLGGDTGGDAEVVVGLKHLDQPDEALLEFAFTAAAGRRVPLRVVHAGEEHDTAVGAAVARWRAAHPQVVVVETAVAGSASPVLLAAAADAALVVVGRGRSRVGPVVHGLLHHAHSPVAVVPHT